MLTKDELITSETPWPPFAKTEVKGHDRVAISMYRWAPDGGRSLFDELEREGSSSQGHLRSRHFLTCFDMALSLHEELGKALETMRPGCTKQPAAT